MTEVIDPMIRIRLLGTLAYFRERSNDENNAAELGATDIRTKRRAIAGCYPLWVPLFLPGNGVDDEDIDVAASDLVKLGHIMRSGNNMIRITDAGYDWFREHYPPKSPVPLTENET